MKYDIYKLLQAETYEVINLGGGNLAYVGKLKDELYYIGNEEVLIISTINSKPIYENGGEIDIGSKEVIFDFWRGNKYFEYFYNKMKERGF